MLLMVYIYAVLGVFWFGGGSIVRETPTGINDRANFSNLGMAVLTLLRVLTGDSWAMLMADCMYDGRTGERTTSAFVMSSVYFGSFTLVSYFGVNLLAAVILLKGLGAYFQSGLLAYGTRALLVLRAKRRLMVPVLRLRERRKLGSNLVLVMNEEKETPRAVHKLLLAFDIDHMPMLSGLEQDEHVRSVIQELLTRRALQELDPSRATWIFHAAQTIFLQACWEAARLAHVQTSAGSLGSYDEHQVTKRVRALSRVLNMLCYSSELAHPKTRWPLSGDTALHVAAFFGDPQLTKLLMEHHADPRVPNEDSDMLDLEKHDRSQAELFGGAATPAGLERSKHLKEALLHGNTPVHYVILGFQATKTSLKGETMASSSDRQRRTLEQLLWPQAFSASAFNLDEGTEAMIVGDPAKANANGKTPLHLAVEVAADGLVRTLLGWDDDLLHEPFRDAATPGTAPNSPAPQRLKRQSSANTPSRTRRMSRERRSSHEGNITSPSPLSSKSTRWPSNISTKRVRSLCNVHNLWNGDTPLLTCLRTAGSLLRRKDEERSKHEDQLVLQLFETARKLIAHPYTNVFQCGATSNLDGRTIIGGGASPLLFLLAAAERLQRGIESVIIAVERKELLSQAHDLVQELILKLVARAENEAEIERLRVCLFELHETNAWRVFGADGRTCCLELALRGERRTLLASHWAQEAIQRAWHRASRYHFWASFASFAVLVIATTLVGWLSTGHFDFIRAVEMRALPPPETGLVTITTSAEWFHWLTTRFVPAVAPLQSDGAMEHVAPEDMWYAIDALRVRREVRAVGQCDGSQFGFDLTTQVCAHYAQAVHDASTAWVIIPLQNVTLAQQTLSLLATDWTTGFGAERVIVEANLFAPLHSVFCHVRETMHIQEYGSVRSETSIHALPVWRGSPFLVIVQLITAVGMIMSMINEIRDLSVNGRRHLRQFWNVIDLLHNILFGVVLALFLCERLIDLKPSSFAADTHTDISLIVNVHVAYRQALSLLVLMAWIRLMKYLRTIKSIGILIEVLLVIVRQLFAFFTLWSLLWIGFTSACFAMFGDHVESMSSFTRAGMSILQIIVDPNYAQYEEVGWLGIAYYVLLIVFVTILLTNLLIAILNTSYAVVVQQAQAQYVMLKASITLSFYVRLYESQRQVKLEGERRRRKRSMALAAATSDDLGGLRGIVRRGSVQATLANRRISPGPKSLKEQIAALSATSDPNDATNMGSFALANQTTSSKASRGSRMSAAVEEQLGLDDSTKLMRERRGTKASSGVPTVGSNLRVEVGSPGDDPGSSTTRRRSQSLCTHLSPGQSLSSSAARLVDTTVSTGSARRRLSDVHIRASGAGGLSRAGAGSRLARSLDSAQRKKLTTYSVEPSEQLRKYMDLEAAGLQSLQAKFFWQMQHEAFGSALQKLRYIRQVYTACGEDYPESNIWLLNHGPSMLTPNLEPVVVQLCIRFPEVDSTELLALLRVCDESAARVKQVLSGEKILTMYQQIQLRVQREGLHARLGIAFCDRMPTRSKQVCFSDQVREVKNSFTRRTDRAGRTDDASTGAPSYSVVGSNGAPSTTIPLGSVAEEAMTSIRPSTERMFASSTSSVRPSSERVLPPSLVGSATEGKNSSQPLAQAPAAVGKQPMSVPVPPPIRVPDMAPTPSRPTPSRPAVGGRDRLSAFMSPGDGFARMARAAVFGPATSPLPNPSPQRAGPSPLASNAGSPRPTSPTTEAERAAMGDEPSMPSLHAGSPLSASRQVPSKADTSATQSHMAPPSVPLEAATPNCIRLELDTNRSTYDSPTESIDDIGPEAVVLSDPRSDDGRQLAAVATTTNELQACRHSEPHVLRQPVPQIPRRSSSLSDLLGIEAQPGAPGIAAASSESTPGLVPDEESARGQELSI